MYMDYHDEIVLSESLARDHQAQVIYISGAGQQTARAQMPRGLQGLCGR